MYLESVVDRAHDPYTIFEISKASGKAKRSIAAPEAAIAEAQRWLMQFVFNKMRIHDQAFAYIKTRSAAKSAALHVGSTWMLKMDIKDFFHQVDERRVYRLLRDYRYEPLAALQIARLTTRLAIPPQPWLPKRYERPTKPRAGSLPHPPRGHLGYLPQGAPSSGAVSNAICFALDSLLTRLASDEGIVYTRYADDMAFSSSSRFSRVRVERLVGAASAIINQEKFSVNPTKTRFVSSSSRISLLGIDVTPSGLQLAKPMRSRIEGHLWGIERFGLTNHSDFRGFADPESMLRFLKGCIDYAHDVEPKRAAEYLGRFDAAVSRFR